MSKTYEALKKAEAEKVKGWQSPAENAAMEKNRPFGMSDVGTPALLGYQKIRT